MHAKIKCMELQLKLIRSLIYMKKIQQFLSSIKRHAGPILRNFSGCTISKVYV